MMSLKKQLNMQVSSQSAANSMYEASVVTWLPSKDN